MVRYASRKPELTRNLLRLYRRATPVDIADGSVWYPNAHKIITEWAETYQRSTVTVACVVAAISPQCEWSRNLIIADDILAGRPVSVGGALHVNIDKARRILRDDATDITRYFKCGPKVTSFAVNLAGDYDYPTIDTHASQAALNDPLTKYLVGTWPRYTLFAECYMRAAQKLNLKPAIFQAIIWHTWKRLHPQYRKLQRRTEWVSIAVDETEERF